MEALWFILGLLLALPLLAIGSRTKADYLPHLYGSSLVLAAAIYVGFAAVWGDLSWRLIEIAGIATYGVFYWLAVRYSLLWIAVGWLLHPIWDVVLHLRGPGSHVVPEWYAILCLSFDLAVAAYVATQWRRAALSRRYLSKN